MMQQKEDSKKLGKIDLRSKFLALPAEDQQRISHFFNLHNAAGFCYDQMSNDAKEYTNYCIQLSQEQKEDSAQES